MSGWDHWLLTPDFSVQEAAVMGQVADHAIRPHEQPGLRSWFLALVQ